MAKLFGRENKNSNFLTTLLDVDENIGTFLDLRPLIISSKINEIKNVPTENISPNCVILAHP